MFSARMEPYWRSFGSLSPLIDNWATVSVADQLTSFKLFHPTRQRIVLEKSTDILDIHEVPISGRHSRFLSPLKRDYLPKLHVDV